MLLASPVWHYWASVLLIVPIILACVATVVLYLRKVEQLRYPKADQERG